MFMVPTFLVEVAINRQDHLYAGSDTVISKYINTDRTDNINLDLTNSILDGYTPKNRKLLTFPFNYLLVSNNSGNEIIYRYEDFYTITNGEKNVVPPSFVIQSCLTPSGSIRMKPFNYKGIAMNEVEGINLGKFPICSWDTDVYTNWLTQNGVNIGLNAAGSLLSIGASAMTGNPIGVASGVLGIANSVGEIYKESLVPPQAEGNINCGDVVTASGNNDFHFQCMSIKREYAEIIDGFMSMYGYKTNKVKIPNITGRSNWNYVKTINANLLGDIPQEDIQELKDIFNEGVTLWHNPETFLDYSQNNI